FQELHVEVSADRLGESVKEEPAAPPELVRVGVFELHAIAGTRQRADAIGFIWQIFENGGEDRRRAVKVRPNRGERGQSEFGKAIEPLHAPAQEGDGRFARDRVSM